MPASRREFVQTAAGLALAASSATAAGGVPRRKLGKTGLDISILGLGGARVGNLKDNEEAIRVIRRFYDLGVNYFDSASSIPYGVASKRYGEALADVRKDILIGTKTRHRTFLHAKMDLEQSFRYLKTDYLDLYQVHNVQSDEDVELILGPRGVLEFLAKAKKDGLVRNIGITGHTDPKAMNKLMAAYDWDTVLIPLSILEGARNQKSFEAETLPAAKKNGIGLFAMKTTAAGALLTQRKATIDECLNYAWTLGADCNIVGCDSVSQVEDDVRIAKAHQPMSAARMDSLRARAQTFDLAALQPWKGLRRRTGETPPYLAD